MRYILRYEGEPDTPAPSPTVARAVIRAWLENRLGIYQAIQVEHPQSGITAAVEFYQDALTDLNNAAITWDGWDHPGIPWKIVAMEESTV